MLPILALSLRQQTSFRLLADTKSVLMKKKRSATNTSRQATKSDMAIRDIINWSLYLTLPLPILPSSINILCNPTEA